MRTVGWFAAIGCLLLAEIGGAGGRSAWREDLLGRIVEIDKKNLGNLGVYVKRVDESQALGYDDARPWYMSSTTKVPVAIVLLQKVEEGEFSLDREFVLQTSDYVDGSGDTIWDKPGTRLTARVLLERMLTQSDSTATDMLIRMIGEKELNRHFKARVASSGFGRITTLLEVRKEVYAGFHPKARALTNTDFIELKKVEPDKKLEALASKLRVSVDELKFRTLQEGYEEYFSRGDNSAELASYGRMLERLVEGKLLNAENTRWLIGLMEKTVTGEKRIKAGLGPMWRFAQKTGTQQGRICNVGIVRGEVGSLAVIAACLEKFEDRDRAEQTLEQLGRAVASSGALDR